MSTRSPAGAAAAGLLLVAAVAGLALDCAEAAGRKLSREQAVNPRITDVKRPNRIVSPYRSDVEMRRTPTLRALFEPTYPNRRSRSVGRRKGKPLESTEGLKA